MLRKKSQNFYRQLGLELVKMGFKIGFSVFLVMGVAIANILPGWAAIEQDKQEEKIITMMGDSPAIAQNLESDSVSDLAEENSDRVPFNDGIYLFGEVPQLGEIGQTYIILQVHRGEVEGALYQLQSEYACFTGSVEGQQLSLSVEDLDGQWYAHSLPLRDREVITTSDNRVRMMGLQGYHAIEEISDLPLQLLNSCQE